MLLYFVIDLWNPSIIAILADYGISIILGFMTVVLVVGLVITVVEVVVTVVSIGVFDWSLALGLWMAYRFGGLGSGYC